MIKILGANVCKTRNGLDLSDGGACLLIDGQIQVAIAEERLNRKKYSGGFSNSISYCLGINNLDISDIDLFVFSICCDVPLDLDYMKTIIKESGIPIPLDKVAICPSHHLSHASSAFFVSPFTNAIIIVSDGEGNIIGSRDDFDHWGNRNERISYFYGNGSSITLLGRDADGVGDLGLGNGYNYISSWIGFPLHQHAGKIMALAAYGQPDRFPNTHVFTLDENRIKCLLEPIHTKKSLAVRRLFERTSGIDIGINASGQNPAQLQKDIARLVQDDLERVLIEKTNHLVSQTGESKVCFAGGVALNCVANSAILLKSKASDIFVPPAAGDTGQCLGNALYGYHVILGYPRNFTMNHAYWGKQYTNKEIENVINQSPFISATIPNDLYHDVAIHIANGRIVGWFQGKSEFGPRALGNRSILADPRNPAMKDLLNSRVKFREYFRPFAPSILLEKAQEYLNISIKSPFMLLAANIKQEKLETIPSVVHIDGTARIQSVEQEVNPEFFALISAFHQITGIPILLNTSFNIAGEPIVESPEDAIRCFMSTEIDLLVIGNYLIQKV